MEALVLDVERSQKENAELKQLVTWLPELEKQNAGLSQSKSDFLKQVGRLTTDLSVANKAAGSAKTELRALTVKVKKLDQEIENLEMENNDLLSKQTENKKASQALSTLQAENSNLKTIVDKLRGDGAAPAIGSFLPSDEEKKALEEKIAGLEASLQEWTDLAKVSTYHLGICIRVGTNMLSAILRGV